MIKNQIDGFKVIVKIATYIIVSFHMIDFLENNKYIYQVTKTTYILNDNANHTICRSDSQSINRHV